MSSSSVGYFFQNDDDQNNHDDDDDSEVMMEHDHNVVSTCLYMLVVLGSTTPHAMTKEYLDCYSSTQGTCNPMCRHATQRCRQDSGGARALPFPLPKSSKG